MIVKPEVSSRRRRWTRMACVGVIAAAVVSACGTAKKAEDGEAAQAGAIAPQAPVLVAAIPAIRGPKRTAAVGSFTADQSIAGNYGSWDVADGMRAMVTAAMSESQRFVMIGTAEPDADPAANPAAQFIVHGVVRQFGNATVKPVGAATAPTGAGLASRSAGKVVVELRLEDTTTGKTTNLRPVEENIDASGGIDYAAMRLGSARYLKTPLGEANRRAVTRAVQRIAIEANRQPWSGQVVRFEKGVVHINAGTDIGVKSGDAFTVERVVRRITDPQTGALRALRKKPIGIFRTDTVDNASASGRFSPTDFSMPREGDLVRVIRR
jgi:curli biogenesis system outer membrane secretion channel CsgG